MTDAPKTQPRGFYCQYLERFGDRLRATGERDPANDAAADQRHWNQRRADEAATAAIARGERLSAPVPHVIANCRSGNGPTPCFAAPVAERRENEGARASARARTTTTWIDKTET